MNTKWENVMRFCFSYCYFRAVVTLSVLMTPTLPSQASQSGWSSMAYLLGQLQDPQQVATGRQTEPTFSVSAMQPPVDSYQILSMRSYAVTPFDRGRALRVLQSISAEVPGAHPRCLTCHGVSKNDIRAWGRFLEEKWRLCLENSSSDPAQKINCLRNGRTDGPFSASELGLLVVGTDNKKVKNAFRDAYSQSEWQSHHASFTDAIVMPPSGNDPLNSGEFDELLKWVQGGMPYLDELVTSNQQTNKCRHYVSESLKLKIADSKLTGWRAYHQENLLPFFGCQGGSDSLNCFEPPTDNPKLFALAKDFFKDRNFEAPEVGTTRHVYSIPFETQFWMRSSVDGRFVGYGLSKYGIHPTPDGYDSLVDANLKARITDLKSMLESAKDPNLRIESDFDPFFLPDNSAFTFVQDKTTKLSMCPLGVARDSLSRRLFLNDERCVVEKWGYYQSLGSSSRGSDYYLTTGNFVPDGPTEPSRESKPSFSSTSVLQVAKVLNLGSGFQIGPARVIKTPFLGDFQISPNGSLLISRTARFSEGTKVQNGYRINQLIEQEGHYELQEIGSLCYNGSKANFSYDDRFVVYHHYIESQDYAELGFSSESDPALLSLIASNSSNVYLVDLLTGEKRLLTKVKRGQLALFPHFRADGWIYYELIDKETTKSYVIATDAALRLERL
ncbi:MAG: hypothetical protein COT74_01355 [Bdellovibrionales bacterium CG10_big_fil_rev_8_21_14_0_10_45_34]|nr:MAG: hypothetical protein COT74_01355 [Bdellovibrionales bacterium CG10_big_fil_rev_8_21_14_0_10_45_34]